MRIKFTKKMYVGAAAAVGAIGAIVSAVKIAEHSRKKWFGLGYDAGHFTGMAEGVSDVYDRFHEITELSAKVAEEGMAIQKKYDELVDAYDELEQKYIEVCDFVDDCDDFDE